MIAEWIREKLNRNTKIDFQKKYYPLPSAFSFLVQYLNIRHNDFENHFNKVVPMDPTNHYVVFTADSRKFTCLNIFFSQNLKVLGM